MSDEAARFRETFRRLHAKHRGCASDEWLHHACRDARGRPHRRPVCFSRRNGPWQRTDILWVGAAPGNAGGRGSSLLGAHGTRIPFGGDVAGANLDVLLASIGLDRNRTFITATLNELPGAGGGEPTAAEIAAPAGDYPSSLHALRDTLVAAGPRLVVALGNVAVRALLGAANADPASPVAPLPSLAAVQKAGLARGEATPWPGRLPPSAATRADWHAAWGDAPLPHILWLTHPSAQNMSPHAGAHTVFHARMRDARDQLQRAVREVLGWAPPLQRSDPPEDGIYALPEWRDLVGPRHATLSNLWSEKGI